MRWIFRLFMFAALGVGGWYGYRWYLEQQAPKVPEYRTSVVKRGDLLVAIGSSGVVQPEEVVDVGAQVAGKIVRFGEDARGNPIDYGSPIVADSILAEIDDSVYQAEMNSARAQFDQATAGVKRSEADLEQSKARLAQAEADWKRAQELISDSLTQAEYDSAKAAFEIAKANVSVSEAAIIQSKSSVKQAEAVIFRAERNLGFCVIKSPVDGVIIDRRVNVGQTVVSSLNAPSLFLIAKDLKRMEVWVAVNEADIGQIHPDQNVTFTCDAFPGETFTGTVSKMRLNATLTQNVVTYTVEVITDNSTNRLLPYLTANVSFEIDKRENVVLVPNAALRYTPSVVIAAREKERETQAATGAGSAPVATTPSATSGAATADATNPGERAKSDAIVAGEGAPPATAPSGDGAKAADASSAGSEVASLEGAKSDGSDPSAESSSGREGRGSREGRGGWRGGEGGGRRSRGGSSGGGSGRSGASGGTGSSKRGATAGEGIVWIMKDGVPESITVKTGITDDQNTEILSDNIQEGMVILTGEVVQDDPNATPTTTSNPFAPPMMGRNRGSGGMGGMGGGGRRSP